MEIEENENKDNNLKEQNNEKEEENNIENNIKEEENNIKNEEKNIKEEENNIKEEENKIKNEEEPKLIDNNAMGKLEQDNNILNIQNDNVNKKENIIEEISTLKDENNINLLKINKESMPKEEKLQDIQTNKNPEKVLNIPIYIHSAKTVQINTVPVIIYIIRGKLVHKEILRTFNDFDLFYQVLSITWPCICIPGIVFKPSTSWSNSEIKFPDIKTKLLNHFFKKLSESKPLINCVATKIFLSQDKNYSIKLSNLNSPNVKEISERYSNTFTDYVDNKKITDEKEKAIKRFMKLLDITYKKFADVRKTIETEIYNIKKEQNSLDFITTMLLDIEKSIPYQTKCLADINDVVKPLKSVRNIIII